MTTPQSKDSLGDRMKQYERTSQDELIRRIPVIIRVDGRSFHTFTKRFKTSTGPYSDQLHRCMMFTAQQLVQQIQGCRFAYKQSDEISLLCEDWDTLLTQPWFGYNVQKMTSISAAIASNAFNYYLHNVLSIVPSQMSDYASFDSRVHNLPYEEIENYFIWRQQDATRNSIQMYGQFFFPHKQLQGVSCDALQGKMLLEKDFNWNDVPTWQKRGSVVTKDGTWDMEIPIFTQQREWIMSQSL